MKKVVLIAIIIFLLSLVVHFYPVYKKGTSFSPLNLSLARNLALTDKYSVESEKNIILSSSRVKDEGIRSNTGNELTSLIYGGIFKVFGFNSEFPFYASLILWSLSGVILFFIVLKLFNLKIAVIFGLIDIFIPVFTQGSLMGGFYEWAVLFFSLGLLFYLYREKTNWLNLVLASLFFGLATLAKNSFIVCFVPFVLFDLYKNRSVKRAIIFVLPFVLVFGGYLMSGYVTGLPNAYLSSQDTDFSRYGHLFPDPYVYHFERDQFLENVAGNLDADDSWFLEKYGYSVSLKDRLTRYWHVISFYPMEFIKIIVIGGPLILLLFLAGLVYLYKEKKNLFWLFVIWGFSWYGLLIFFKSANWDHFLEIRFLVSLPIALGVVWLIGLLPNDRNKKIGILFFVIFLLLHFGLANKWMLHDEYSGSKIKTIRELSLKINNENLDKKTDVIVVNIHPTMQALNYYTDQSIIYFDISTINRLLNENKLNEAFKYFEVTKIIGFSDEISERIFNQTGVGSIE